VRFAEAANSLDLEAGPKAPAQPPDKVGEITEDEAPGKSKGTLTGAAEAFTEWFQGREKQEREPKRVKRPATRRKEV
jgi:hypothetical protein